jgi:hypothetical protein
MRVSRFQQRNRGLRDPDLKQGDVSRFVRRVVRKPPDSEDWYAVLMMLTKVFQQYEKFLSGKPSESFD